jgi:hypothetical protein
VKPGSTGTAVPGYELRIVDLDEREVTPGTIGGSSCHGKQFIALLLESSKADSGADAWKMVFHGRQVLDRSRRLLLVCGPFRRYVQGIGSMGLAS